MNQRLISNGLLFTALLAVPLVAELSTTTPNNIPGTGFSVLLYEPFDFAYVLLAAFIFVALNIHLASKQRGSKWAGFGLGIFLLLVWFVVSFLAVGQLHLSLGGKL